MGCIGSATLPEAEGEPLRRPLFGRPGSRPFPVPASREGPGGGGAGAQAATGGQQRPFPDPTPSASQLSRRRSAPGAWEAEQGESPRGAASPRRPLFPSPSISLEPGPPAGTTIGGVAPSRDGGREEPGLAPPLPGPPLPSAGWRRAGRGPRVSLCLRHRPRSCRRPSGRYPGPGAGVRGVPGARPRESTVPFSAWPPAGEGPSAGRFPSARTRRLGCAGVRTARPGPAWATARAPGNCPAGPVPPGVRTGVLSLLLPAFRNLPRRARGQLGAPRESPSAGRAVPGSGSRRWTWGGVWIRAEAEWT